MRYLATAQIDFPGHVADAYAYANTAKGALRKLDRQVRRAQKIMGEAGTLINVEVHAA